jgi:hypothetical protein
MHMAGSAAIAYLAASSLWTANDPFVGTWTLDVSRSVIVDQMAIEAAGPNRFTFRFEGAPAETVVADGRDQPGLPGTTLSVKSEDARTMKVVRKQGDRVIVSALWKLSRDGRTLRDTFTGQQPDGSTVAVDYLYKRMSGTSGFAGVWESTTPPTGLVFELQIQPYGAQGLSFVRQSGVKSVTFDGRDHAEPGGAEGAIATGRRTTERAMTFTEKAGGKVVDTQALTLSRDGKTLTMNVKRAGQATANRFVLQRR